MEPHTGRQLLPRDIRILKNLQHLAQDVSPVANARLAAAIAVRGDIISFGNNSLRSHPFAGRWGKNEHSHFWHAETHAIYNALKKHNVDILQRATLYVVRVKRPHETSREWILGTSKPCKGCRRCIFEFGIPRLVYGIESEFVCEGVDH
jgi:tRNA(Arg) A34 adenosine deaminase TadA